MSPPAPPPATPPVVEVVDFARRAPSIHNTQPWRWRARGDRLDLYADRERQLPTTDPSGRGMVISCGAALRHARVAAAALGWPAEVRGGDPGSRDHLATLRLRPGRSTPADEAAYDLLERRRTDRRRFTSWPVPAAKLEGLASESSTTGVTVVPVTTDVDRRRLEVLASLASHTERTEPGFAEEQQSWLDRSPTDGVPSTALGEARRGRRPSRFDRPGSPDAPDDLRATDGALVLCAPDDGPASWLSVGEVLCQLWARAMEDGLSLVPLNQPIEVDQTRAALGSMLGRVDHPHLVLRIGWQEIARSPLPPTPRRPLTEVLVE